ncbi:hypothetical protein SELMODRAFT_107428 [Selaginella moellendorffii]|uniref:TFIIE beta domain-containing protein n=1 Tax=Selaginella moellendorffii TaxID=88036 RepID=D8S339_SELML|nr:general transcription factor IIE subunit 2 [Selaginella moellendorffii]XP_002979570.1 general transcription factor IIE subunit 2 [Selaginella moellendorffii]EFJ19459.1 hypothetical protein SELMODRAFT_419190 [Selaginella moellendorffii]EFJ21040.1 hypothetical protein SELMODRAFT_107428 [Selaginella moellendorffii]|eukprot:XP_002977702.1 general transcription factor IIE subunit 2 [Selaginella moellendorffii]
MAELSRQLNKFKQQQQALTDVAVAAAKRSGGGSKKKPPVAPAAPAAPPGGGGGGGAAPSPAPPSISNLTFQNDKEKLQMINQVRRSPTMAQVKRVLDVLLETREALLPDEINNRCFVDVANNKEVFETLKNNVKVSFDGQRFSYKAKHGLKNKAELLVQLRKCTEGMALSELRDAYPGIVSDVQELKASGEIRVMCNSDSQEEILYPDDPRMKIKVDEDIAKLCRSIELPTDFVLVERELQKNGVRPMTNSVLRRERMSLLSAQQGGSKQKKKKKISKRTKYTNIHLPELFKSVPSDVGS